MALSVSKMTCFGLSASKMIYFWVISVEDDLFVGYQHRQLLILGLAASKMTYVWVISVEDELFLGVDDDLRLGHQRRR